MPATCFPVVFFPPLVKAQAALPADTDGVKESIGRPLYAQNVWARDAGPRKEPTSTTIPKLLQLRRAPKSTDEQSTITEKTTGSANAAHKEALGLSGLRKRFLSARGYFTWPTTPDYGGPQRRRNAESRVFSRVPTSTGALILRLAYGYAVKDDQDQDTLVRVVEIAMQGSAKVSEPGAFLVDYFPALRYVPECSLPHAFVRQQMRATQGSPGYLDEKREPTPADEALVKAAAASLYSGGADTTPSSMIAFILVMTLWPSIQKRAQAELGLSTSAVPVDVAGPGHIPSAPLGLHLPILSCREVFLWSYNGGEKDADRQSLLPMGLWALGPHRNSRSNGAS
ncbi:hypothetical protein C8Q76DRAFT_798739 [Earliella scabrosa]|nr:hypothetical protein C8Q76DRAFT_798739 [Earliella scabrosa]